MSTTPSLEPAAEALRREIARQPSPHFGAFQCDGGGRRRDPESGGLVWSARAFSVRRDRLVCRRRERARLRWHPEMEMERRRGCDPQRSGGTSLKGHYLGWTA